LGTWCWEYLDLRGTKWLEDGKNYVMRSFINERDKVSEPCKTGCDGTFR
jgi:hypothetical protein